MLPVRRDSRRVLLCAEGGSLLTYHLKLDIPIRGTQTVYVSGKKDLDLWRIAMSTDTTPTKTELILVIAACIFAAVVITLASM